MGPKRRHPIIIDYEGQRPPRKSANRRVSTSEAVLRQAQDQHRASKRRRTVLIAASILPVAALWMLSTNDDAPAKTPALTVSAGTADPVVASSSEETTPPIKTHAAAAKPEPPLPPPVLAPHKAHHEDEREAAQGEHHADDGDEDEENGSGHAEAGAASITDDPPAPEQSLTPDPSEPTGADLAKPTGADLAKPTVADLAKPSGADLAKPTVAGLVEPSRTEATAPELAPGTPKTPAEPDNTRQRRVLVVGIDGFRADSFPYVFIPTLQKLRRSGASHMEGHTNQPTHSGPGWATLLTGQDVGTHGVNDNRFKDMSTFQSQRTIFHDYKARYPDSHVAAFVAWRPIRTHLLKDVPVDITESGSDPDIARKAAALLREDKQLGLLFIHLDAVDQVGHKYGYHYRKKTYRGAITRADTRLGHIMKALDEREDREDWLVVVTTDHGGSLNGSHSQDRPANKRIFAIVAGKGYPAGSTLLKPPCLRDIAPTVRGFIGAAPSSSPGIVMTAKKLPTPESGEAASAAAAVNGP